MSTKEWISAPKDGVGVYQERNYDSDINEVNTNPAVIQLKQAAEAAITQKVVNKESCFQFIMQFSVPAKTFDKIAIDWCKNRKLNTNKYTLVELLSKSNSQQPNGNCELTEAKVAQERADQPEIDADIEMDNIFSIISAESLDAEYMQKCSNELLQLREAGRKLSQEYPILSKISNDEEHGKALMMIEMLLGRVDLCCTYFAQQYIGNHININASDTMLA